jgi:hypothetical protein
MIVNKEFVNFISFTQWVKKFLDFKPQGVASFAASAVFRFTLVVRCLVKKCNTHLHRNDLQMRPVEFKSGSFGADSR